jgi:predicted dienelactone hydrolase
MRGFEAILVLVEAVTALLLGITASPPAFLRKCVAAIPLIFVAPQVAFEGVRWQMIPAYLVAAILLAASFRPRVSPWLVAGSFVVLGGTAALCVAFPVFSLPAPGGRYPIGITTRHLTDLARAEPRAIHPGDRRELMIQIWYPADRSGPPFPYRPRAETSLRSRHFALVPTHASAGVPLARGAGRLPVVLYSPSWTGRRTQNTVQAEDLASRGFLVVAIDHPYGSFSVTFPDGRVAVSPLGEFLGGTTADDVEASRRIAVAELSTWTADLRFVLDELARLDQSDPERLLTDRIDFGRVGAFGYSFGGAVVSEASRRDSRIKAVVNYDGMLFGEAAERGIELPFLYVTDSLPDVIEGERIPGSPGEARTGDAWRDALMARDCANLHRSLETHGGSVLVIPHANHSLYCDSSFYTPLNRLRMARNIDSRRVSRVMTEVTAAFFEQNLLSDTPDHLARAPSIDPVAYLRTWPANGTATRPRHVDITSPASAP